MSEGEFIDGAEGVDPFDPADLDEAMAKLEKNEEGSTDVVRDLIETRRVNYTNVFTEGHTDQACIDYVLTDLAWFCRAFAPTFDKRDGPHADTLMKLKEGRREVHARIADFSCLSFDALLLKYTDATTK